MTAERERELLDLVRRYMQIRWPDDELVFDGRSWCSEEIQCSEKNLVSVRLRLDAKWVDSEACVRGVGGDLLWRDCDVSFEDGFFSIDDRRVHAARIPYTEGASKGEIVLRAFVTAFGQSGSATVA